MRHGKRFQSILNVTHWRRNYLKKQYFRAQMKEGTSMNVHIKCMKNMADRQAAIGAKISSEDQVVTLLGSLPEGYSTLVTALEARADENLEFCSASVTKRKTETK